MRLVTSGFECQTIDTGAATRTEGLGYQIAGAPTIETSVVRSGAACLKCTTLGDYASWTGLGTVLDRTYYLRFYLRFPTAPSVNAVVCSLADSALAQVASLRLSTARALALLNKAGTNLGSTTLAVDTWYRVEVAIRVNTSGNGELGLWVNGVQIVNNTSTNVGNVALGPFRTGITVGTVPAIYVDDVAINDDQGANQNGLPGEGRLVFRKATADSSVSGFTAGAGGTTNLYNAVDNIPPVGVVAGSATDTSQIKSGINNTTDYYEATLEAYNVSEIGPYDLVTLVQAIANAGDTDAVAQVSTAVSVTANPADNNEGTRDTGPEAAGTYPVGWKIANSPVVYAPSVTLGTSPKIKVRRAFSSTAVLHVDQVGLYVEYVRAAVLPLDASAGLASTSLLVSAQTALALAASGGLATAVLSLVAQTQVSLAASSAQSAATLSLSAQTQVPLDASAGVASTSLALTAQTQLPLETSAATSAATLALSAQTTLPLGAAAATSSASLALSGQTQVPLGAAAAQSSASLNLETSLVPNPGFEVNLTGWSSTGYAPTTFARQSGWASRGSWSARVAGDIPSGANQFVLETPGGTSGAAVTAGSVYSLAVALNVLTAVPAGAVKLRIYWWDTGGSSLGFSEAVSTQTAGVSEVTVVGTAPASTAKASVLLAFTGMTAGPLPFDGYFDDVRLYLATVIPLGASAGLSAATLALTAAQQVPLSACAAQSSAALALSAQTQLPLNASAAVSTASLSLVSQTQLPLSSSTAVSSATLGLTAQTQLPLQASAGTSSTSLTLGAQTQVGLNASAGISTGTLALTAQTQLPLNAAAAVSTTSLTLGAQTTLPLGSAAGVSSTSLALAAQTTVPLNSAQGVSGASLALTAPTGLALDPAAGSSTTSLSVTSTLTLPLAPSVGVSTASLALSAPTALSLQSAGISSATLAVSAQTRIALGTSAGLSSTTFLVSSQRVLVLGASAGISSATFVLTLGAPRWGMDPENRWTFETNNRWPLTTSERW